MQVTKAPKWVMAKQTAFNNDYALVLGARWQLHVSGVHKIDADTKQLTTKFNKL